MKIWAICQETLKVLTSVSCFRFLL